MNDEYMWPELSTAPQSRASSFLFYFHVGDTFLSFGDSDCHAPFGTTHSSIFSTHARTKCATETVLISAGNDFLLCSVGRLFTVWYSSPGGNFFSFFLSFSVFSLLFKRNQKGQSEAAI